MAFLRYQLVHSIFFMDSIYARMIPDDKERQKNACICWNKRLSNHIECNHINDIYIWRKSTNTINILWFINFILQLDLSYVICLSEAMLLWNDIHWVYYLALKTKKLSPFRLECLKCLSIWILFTMWTTVLYTFYTLLFMHHTKHWGQNSNSHVKSHQSHSMA